MDEDNCPDCRSKSVAEGAVGGRIHTDVMLKNCKKSRKMNPEKGGIILDSTAKIDGKNQKISFHNDLEIMLTNCQREKKELKTPVKLNPLCAEFVPRSRKSVECANDVQANGNIESIVFTSKKFQCDESQLNSNPVLREQLLCSKESSNELGQKEAESVVSITFRQVFNTSKAFVVPYLGNIVGFVLDEKKVDIVSEHQVNVCLPSEMLGHYFINKIAALPVEFGIVAMIHKSIEDELRSIWKNMSTKVEKALKLHAEKITAVEKRLDELKAKKTFLALDRFERITAERKSVKSKFEELNDQKMVFEAYLKSIRENLFELKNTSNLKQEIDKLRNNFALELSRLSVALPIYAKKMSIIEMVHLNQVSIIIGETGSGKSTQMLQYLHDAGFGTEGIIVCTQPRKVAALSLARRVAQEMGSSLGHLVGYQAGMQSKCGPQTRLMYVTDHVLLNECLKDPTFSKYSCIVIDEAHERSIFTDLLLGFIKRVLPHRSELRVVITSATIRPETFVNFFGGNTPVLYVSGRAFPVEVTYEALSDEDEYVKAASQKAMQVHADEPAGDILVFLTSPIETEKACKTVQDKSENLNFLALELHGRLQVEDQQKVFDPTPDGKRKIIFATNCAETSVTIPGVKYVIDTGRVREVSYDPAKNMSALKLTWVTKSSAEQRKGRAGRTDCGKCFRLYTLDQYNDFRLESVPEILRVHLGQAVLKLMSLGISDPFQFDFVDAPSKVAMISATNVLIELDAINEEGITEIGRKLAKMSIEPRLGKVALMGVQEDIAFESLIMTAIASAGGSIFFRVGSDDQKLEADKKKTR